MKLSLGLLTIAATLVAAAPTGNFNEKRASCTGTWAAKDLDARSTEPCPPLSLVEKRASCNGYWASKDLDARSIELRNEACQGLAPSDLVEKRASCLADWAAKDEASIKRREVECEDFQNI